MKFVRAIPREYTAYGYDYVHTRVAPMALTAAPDISKRMLLQGNKVDAPDIMNQRYGQLETYVCVGCGFVEWYCQDPEHIPIGPEYMTDVVDYEANAPYR
jgi:hypothetical protein